jgi:hypothetical protein
MADVAEKGYGSGSSDDGSQRLIFQRPTGLKGFYYHPLTQVGFLCVAISFFSNLYISRKVSMLGFVCFMCPGVLAQYAF